jgi:hypothetical protein
MTQKLYTSAYTCRLGNCRLVKMTADDDGQLINDNDDDGDQFQEMLLNLVMKRNTEILQIKMRQSLLRSNTVFDDDNDDDDTIFHIVFDGQSQIILNVTVKNKKTLQKKNVTVSFA